MPKGLRLTKQQKTWQEEMLKSFNLAEEFEPAANLAGALAYALVKARRKEQTLTETLIERITRPFRKARA